jgi:hypothetical protein
MAQEVKHCLTSAKLRVQTPVPPKTKTKTSIHVSQGKSLLREQAGNRGMTI